MSSDLPALTVAQTGRNSRMMAQGRSILATQVFVLARQEVFVATATSTSGLYDEYVLTSADFEGLGPYVEDLVLHVDGSNFTNDLEYDAVLQYRFANGSWNESATTLLSVQNSVGYVISPAFSDRAALGMRIRIVLRCNIGAGGSAGSTQRGTFNVAVAVRYYN